MMIGKRDQTSPSAASEPPELPPPPTTGSIPIVQPTVLDPSPTSDYAPRWLRVSGGYAWRFIAMVLALAAIVYGVSRVWLVAIALFIALVITAVLRPLANLLDRVMPRALATIVSFLVGVGVLAGLGTFVGISVANQVPQLSVKLMDGIAEIEILIDRLPPPIGDIDLSNIGETVTGWVQSNAGTIWSEAVSRAGSLVEGMTAVVLAIFCSVFFINSGSAMWRWFLALLPVGSEPKWRTAGETAWKTFSGYSRGIFLVAATNGLFAGIGLAILRVPLAAPLGVLVFFGTFIPLIGAPVAMAVAVMVALAARGPWIAVAVLVMIVLIGQLEGHLLQPLIMGKQVSLHPVAVAVAVVGGTLVAGVLGAVVAVPIVAVVWAVFAALRTYNRALLAADAAASAGSAEVVT